MKTKRNSNAIVAINTKPSPNELWTCEELASKLRVSYDYLFCLRSTKKDGHLKEGYIDYFKMGKKVIYKKSAVLEMLERIRPNFSKDFDIDFLLPKEVASMLKVSLDYLAALRSQNGRYDKDGCLRPDFIEYIKLGKKVVYPRKAVELTIKRLEEISGAKNYNGKK